MEEKHQPDSMATITMKPEYPPSEVYSTSEPPPAYRQRVSSSVQIARIAALTVVASAFILGAFILASSWVAAHASCHQLEQLDAMLDKELALEGRAYGNDALLPDEPLPIGNAHALHAAPPAPMSSVAPPPPSQPEPVVQAKDDALSRAESKINEDRLQRIDDDKSESHNGSDETSESDSSAEEEDELDAVRPFKLPIHFDLDDLAGAFLANNQKGRMNCMVERRRDEPSERRFPFNIFGSFAPRQQAQAERIAIICHGGDEQRPMIPEPQSQVFAFPLTGPVRLPLRPQPERPAPGGEPRMPPFGPMGPMGPMGSMGPMPQRHNAPFPLSLPWDSSEEQMSAPREMRIHVQRVIAIPAPHNMPPAPQNMPPPPENMGPFAPPPPPPQNNDQNEQPTVLHQFVPQSAPTQELEQPEGGWQVQKMQMEGSPVQMSLPWGLTPEDVRAIHRTAEEASQRRNQPDNDMQEMKTIMNSLAAAAQAEAEAEAQTEARAEAQARAEAEAAPQEEHQQDAPPMTLAAPARAQRTLLLPLSLPQEMDERPHYMQPRSVHSADAPTLERFRRDVVENSAKRVKRCACDCM